MLPQQFQVIIKRLILCWAGVLTTDFGLKRGEKNLLLNSVLEETTTLKFGTLIAFTLGFYNMAQLLRHIYFVTFLNYDFVCTSTRVIK